MRLRVLPIALSCAACLVSQAAPDRVAAGLEKRSAVEIAEGLQERGEIGAAVKIYRRFLGTQPADPEAETVALRIAELTYALRREDALPDYRVFLRRFGYSDRDGRGRYGTAECLFERGAFVEAQKAFAEVLGQTPNLGSALLPHARLRAGWSLYAQGRTAEAEAEFRSLARLFHGTQIGSRAELGKGACALKRGEYEAADGIYKAVSEASRIESIRNRARFGRACAAVLSWKSLRGGVQILRTMAKSEDSAEASFARLWLARTYVRQRDFGPAVEAYRELYERSAEEGLRRLAMAGLGKALSQRALPPDPGDQLAWFALAGHDAVEGREARALARFQLAAKANPDGALAPESFLYAGLCAERSGEYAIAAEHYEKGAVAAEHRPRLAPRILLGASRARVRLRDGRRALTHLRRFESLVAEPAATYEVSLIRAIALLQTGSVQAAAAELDALATRAPPESPYRREAMVWRGRALARLGRHRQAVAEFRACLKGEEDPESAARVRMELARELVHCEQPEEAKALIAREQNLLDAARRGYSLGAVEERMGRPSDALAHYEAAMETAKSAELRGMISARKVACLHKLKRPEQAMAELRNTINAFPAVRLSPSAYAWGALDAFLRGADEEVIQTAAWFLEAERHRAEQAEQTLFLLGRSLQKIGKWRRLDRVAASLLRRFPAGRFRDHALLDRAEALVNLQQTQAARGCLKNSAFEFSVRGLWLLAESYRVEGLPEKAVGIYERILTGREDLGSDWAVRVYLGLARARRLMNDAPRSALAYRRAANVSPVTLRGAKLQEEARDELGRLNEQHPTPP